MPYDPAAFKASVAQGSKLKLKCDPDAPNAQVTLAFHLIPGVQDIDGPGGSKTSVEYTAISDTEPKKLGGMPDYGDITFDMAEDAKDGVQQCLERLYNTPNTIGEFELHSNDHATTPSKKAFNAICTQFRSKKAKNGVSMISVRLELTGPVTSTPRA